MRPRPALLLALVLGPALAPALAPEAAAQAAAPFGVTPAEGDLRTVFRFEAPASLLGPELLEDAAFEGELAPWSLESEVRGETSVETREGVAYLAAGPATRQGTVFLHQTVSPPPGWVDFRVGARLVEGEAARGVLLFRQHAADGNGSDTLVFFDLEPVRSEVRAHFQVRADTRTLAVLLRYEMLPGQTATVAFDAPTLRPSPRLAWTFPGGETALGAVVERALGRAGHHDVSLAADGRPVGNVAVRVEDRPPVAEMALTRRDQGWFLDGRESRDPDAPQHLRNGDFSRGTTGWTLEAAEVANDSTMEAAVVDGRDALRIRTGARHPAGSVWAYQEVRGPPRGPLEFRVDVRDDGDHEGYAILLREVTRRGARDTLVQAEALGEWQRLHALWTPAPDATRLYVQLRYLAPADREVGVAFANASLTPALAYDWSIGRRAIGDQPLVPWIDTVAPFRTVRLDVTDAGGATVSVTRQIASPPILEGVPGPSLVTAGRPAAWSAADVRFASLEMARNGGFDRELASWRLDADEIGGNATAALDAGPSGPALRVDFNATANGTLVLSQRIAIRNLSYDLSFLRKDAGVQEHSVLLRELGSRRVALRAQPWDDTRVLLPASPEWKADLVRWRPKHNDSTHVLLTLRAVVREGDAGSVWLDNVSFQPSRAIRWSVDGVDHGGPAELRLALAPGPHVLNLSLGASGQRVNVTLPVYALDLGNVSLHAALDGAIRASWRFPDDAPIEGVRLAYGGRRTDLPGRQGAYAVPEPPPDATYRLEALSPGHPPLPLANGTYRPGFFAELANVTPEAPTRGDEVTLVARVHDPHVAALEALVDGQAVPMSRGGNGTWAGVWRVPLLRGEGDATVTFRGRDAEGREGTTPGEAVPVLAFEGGARPLPWLLLLAGAALAAWVLPWAAGVMRSRRGG